MSFIQELPINCRVITPDYPGIGSRTGTIVGVAADNIIRAYIVELDEPYYDKRYKAFCKCYSYNSLELKKITEDTIITLYCPECAYTFSSGNYCSNCGTSLED